MGMGGGFGQIGGATGVGSATTQTGNQQLAAPTGGKGGSIPQGMQQPMQRIMQPQQFQQPYRPFGGDVYGYNMNRLARQMDPSATLPVQPTPLPESIYTQPGFVDYGYGAPQMGGKGGGMGGMGGYGPPQFFSPFTAPNPFYQPQAYLPQPTPAPAAPAAMYDDSALRAQIIELQNQLAGRPPTPPPATSASTPNSVRGLYQQYLGRDPESAANEQYWNQRFGQTIDPNEVEEFVRAANQERRARGMANVPGFDLGEIDYGIANRTNLSLNPEGASADAPAPAPVSTTTRPNIGGPFTSFVDAANAVGSPPPPPPPYRDWETDRKSTRLNSSH